MKIYFLDEMHNLATTSLRGAVSELSGLSTGFRTSFLNEEGDLLWNSIILVNGEPTSLAGLDGISLSPVDEVHLILQLAGG